MGELYAYSSEVTSVFQLIGTLENDITKSIAWALCKCPAFMKKIIGEILHIDIDPEKVRIGYQEFEKDRGITDLEITDDDSLVSTYSSSMLDSNKTPPLFCISSVFSL